MITVHAKTIQAAKTEKYAAVLAYIIRQKEEKLMS